MAKGTKDTDTNPTEGSEQKLSPRVKYLGSSVHTRELTDNDFKKLGLDGVGVQRWSPENNHIVDFTEHADGVNVVKLLTENDIFKGEFKALGAGEL